MIWLSRIEKHSEQRAAALKRSGPLLALRLTGRAFCRPCRLSFDPCCLASDCWVAVCSAGEERPGGWPEEASASPGAGTRVAAEVRPLVAAVVVVGQAEPAADCSLAVAASHRAGCFVEDCCPAYIAQVDSGAVADSAAPVGDRSAAGKLADSVADSVGEAQAFQSVAHRALQAAEFADDCCNSKAGLASLAAGSLAAVSACPWAVHQGQPVADAAADRCRLQADSGSPAGWFAAGFPALGWHAAEYKAHWASWAAVPGCPA